MDLITGKQDSKQNKWTYKFDPNNEKITGDITLVFGTKPAGNPEVA